MRQYRRLITAWEIAIPTKDAPDAIRVKEANCPADVKFVSDMTAACIGVRSASLAAIPMVIETKKYPRATGIPSFIPFKYICPCMTQILFSYISRLLFLLFCFFPYFTISDRKWSNASSAFKSNVRETWRVILVSVS